MNRAREGKHAVPVHVIASWAGPCSQQRNCGSALLCTQVPVHNEASSEGTDVKLKESSWQVVPFDDRHASALSSFEEKRKDKEALKEKEKKDKKVSLALPFECMINVRWDSIRQCEESERDKKDKQRKDKEREKEKGKEKPKARPKADGDKRKEEDSDDDIEKEKEKDKLAFLAAIKGLREKDKKAPLVLEA